ncbi:MAG: RNA-binding domain-containing protein [Candidatus Bathyarchaeales archaeon]
MDEVMVRVEVEVNPTESEEKVKRAVENMFGNITMERKPLPKGSLLVAEFKGIESLTKLYNLLRRERIRDAARSVLFEGLSGKTVTFFLNKQVAFAGHVSFSKAVAESPLGPIKVEIKCDDPRQLIDWLAPKTQ